MTPDQLARPLPPRVRLAALSTPWLVAAAFAGACGMALADDPPNGAKSLTVPDEPFEVKVTLEAVVTGTDSTEVSVTPEEFNDLTVLEAAEHGQAVQKGETLIRFDDEPLARQIRDLERSTEASEIAIGAARAAFISAESTAPLDLDGAKRQREISAEELDYFESTGRQLREEAARQSLKRSQFAVESAREELEQLKKMYEADDLTEETEEIILKRATQDLERAESNLVAAEAQHERLMETELPREHRSLEINAERAALTADATEATVPVTLAKLRNELASAEHGHREALEKLGRLRADERQVLVLAPHAGTVFYGHTENGTWPTAAAMAKKLRPGGKVLPHEVVMTIVGSSGGTALQATVPEEKMGDLLAPGATGTATLKGSGSEASVRLASLDQIPLASGGFAAGFTFQGEKAPQWNPGRTATVNLTLYRNDDAVAVPEAAVREIDGKHVVSVVSNGETSDRTVEVGRTAGDQIEITTGLEPGEVIALP